MSLFKTVNERRILNSPTEPTSRSWLWLKTENGTSTLYDFVNGAWTPVNGFSDKDTGHGSEYGGDIYNDADYITFNDLNPLLDKNLETVSAWLEGYISKVDLEKYVTTDTIGPLVKAEVDEVLNDYQPSLIASEPLEISGNRIRLKMGTLNQGERGPVAGGTAYAKFQDVFNRLNAKQDKLVSGADIKTINGIDILNTSNGSNLQLQTPISDLAAIRSGAAAGATAVQPSQLKTITIENTAYPLVGNGTIVIPNNGGGGGGTPVSVLDEGEEVPTSGVYFFADSPSQVEGDYNSLLQTAGFSPGNLYYLSPAKRIVNGVEEGYLGYNTSDASLDVRDNVVYINNQMTTTKYYGDVVVSNTVRMADTSDTAYISFMVACPFAANLTTVRVGYNSNDVSVKYLRTAGTSTTSPDWANVPSGGFTFRSIGGGMKTVLKVIRKDKNYNTKKEVIITFNNGYEDVQAKIVYNKTTVYFKGDDVGNECQNGFSISDTNQYIQTSRNGQGDSVLLPSNKRNRFAKIYENTGNNSILSYEYNDKSDCLLKYDVPIDLSKYNVIYLVTDTVSNDSWIELCAFLKNWGGIYRPADHVLEDREMMYAIQNFNNSYYNVNDLGLEGSIIQKFGNTVLKCPIHKTRLLANNSYKDILVNLYVIIFRRALRVKEFGVITYDNQ
jgi:hypothetical protein